MMYVRLKVTISLYLSPNSMARSWPTLTAVIVERHLTPVAQNESSIN